MENKINLFVNSLNLDQLNSLFLKYYDKSCEHLMKYVIYKLDEVRMKLALKDYLITFSQTDPDDERRNLIEQSMDNFDLFKRSLDNDQFFQEPLYQIANRKYNLIFNENIKCVLIN